MAIIVSKPKRVVGTLAALLPILAAGLAGCDEAGPQANPAAPPALELVGAAVTPMTTSRQERGVWLSPTPFRCA